MVPTTRRNSRAGEIMSHANRSCPLRARFVRRRTAFVSGDEARPVALRDSLMFVSILAPPEGRAQKVGDVVQMRDGALSFAGVIPPRRQCRCLSGSPPRVLSRASGNARFN